MPAEYKIAKFLFIPIEEIFTFRIYAENAELCYSWQNEYDLCSARAVLKNPPVFTKKYTRFVMCGCRILEKLPHKQLSMKKL